MNTPTATTIKTTKTADNCTFHVWSDGYVTQAFGIFWKGTRKLPVPLALMVAEEACMFDAKEIPSLLKAAKWLNRASKGKGVLPGDLRAYASELADKEQLAALNEKLRENRRQCRPKVHPDRCQDV